MDKGSILFGVVFVIIGTIWMFRSYENRKLAVWLGVANIVLGVLMVVKTLTHGFHF